MAESNIYMDRQSGKEFDRPQYKIMGDIYRRSCAADLIVCGRIGAVEHTETAGTGDSGGKSKGREVREARSRGIGRISENRKRMGKKKDFTEKQATLNINKCNF